MISVFNRWHSFSNVSSPNLRFYNFLQRKATRPKRFESLFFEMLQNMLKKVQPIASHSSLSSAHPQQAHKSRRRNIPKMFTSIARSIYTVFSWKFQSNRIRIHFVPLTRSTFSRCLCSMWLDIISASLIDLAYFMDTRREKEYENTM